MDQSLPDHYETLGISHNAVAQDIKNAFFALAKTHHPDKNNGGPTKEFVKVRTAYEVLSDRDQRNVYDRQFEKVRPNVGYQTWEAPDNYTYERKRERRYSYRRGSIASEATKRSEAQEAEERRKTEEENIRRASESLDALMKELERISGRLERREY
ncbi:hypothetical protein OCU04_004060 [Sclerotinia nivalis]|uniref:J domain-containing protein n=1 Tax=Sclerotinia nivalis TaxID=352851 RepID=A0A9X0ATA2_9HELO|nr:hypothetical protein OCU04_004060 [Sclerotinia nivalis]